MKCEDCKIYNECLKDETDDERELELDTEHECDDFESKYVGEWEAERMYDEMLDEVYGDIEIAGMHYQTSRALKELDSIAYRCGFNDWLDAEGLEVE